MLQCAMLYYVMLCYVFSKLVSKEPLGHTTPLRDPCLVLPSLRRRERTQPDLPDCLSLRFPE